MQNVIVYAGSANDRRLIRDTEFWYPADSSKTKVSTRRGSY
jgi:hypothetical protein